MTRKKWKDPHAAREARQYRHPIPSRELIMDYLATLDKPVGVRQLAEVLSIKGSRQREALRRRLLAMHRDGQVRQLKNYRYQLNRDAEVVHGRIQANRDGHGYLIPTNGSDDVFLPAREMRSLFDGDTVLVQIVYVDKRGRREGRLLEVAERAFTEVVGRYFVEGGVGFVEPSNKRLTQNIVVPAKEANGAKHGQVVVVHIIAYPSEKSAAVGRITEILGDHMAPGMEIETAIRAHGLPHRWPAEVKQVASQLKPHVLDKDKKGRKDLRHLDFVTIDGEDAKDFDDAVYCEKKQLGGWRLYVAIADVSHYVKPDTVLDKEAYLRGNSVYFPGEVIPMLPKVLSNQLCSLNPKVDRLAMVCEMQITQKGVLKSQTFYPAVIYSKARLTYEEVGAFFENKTHCIDESIQPKLLTLYQLYKLLYAQRLKAGAIIFDTTEVKVMFGAKRKIKKLVPVYRNDAHRLIEECMLCANVATARFLLKHRCDTLFRIHDGPKFDRLDNLREFLSELGLHLSGRDKPTPQDYAAVLKKAKGRKDEHLIQVTLLRSMSQAYYTPDHRPHFGLSFDEYTHFTSPIRRYPDLVVHRTIKAILNRKKKTLPNYEALLQIGTHCSKTERRADEATRDALTWLKCEYMMNRVGEQFEGVISGVVSFGIFIELNDLFVEGLVHINELKGDYYHFDAVRQHLKGRRTGLIYRLGDTVKVKVMRVSLDDRQIDFSLADIPGKKGKKPAFKKKTKGKKPMSRRKKR